MIRHAVTSLVIVLTLTVGSAFSAETQGEIVFKDAMYGLALGAILGGALYLIDDRDLGTKIGVGVVLGTTAGAIYGLLDARSVVTVDSSRNIIVAFPSPLVQKRKNGAIFYSNLIKVDF